MTAETQNKQKYELDKDAGGFGNADSGDGWVNGAAVLPNREAAVCRTERPYLIGLAGQSCAGKNVAAAFLAERGFPVIDADEVTHTVIEEASQDIIAHYSADARLRGLCLETSDGLLDRRNLGVLLFSAPSLLKTYERFILPLIARRMRLLIGQVFEQAPSLPIVLNAPTLHKTALISECAFIIYIEAPYILRLLRCKKRDGLPLRHIFTRFLRQQDFLSQYLSQNADIERVKNTGAPHSLQKKIERLLLQKGI